MGDVRFLILFQDFPRSSHLYTDLAAAEPTMLLSHSALRRSNTTALQQLPVGDHGGRINTHVKGSALGERRLSAKLKKWEAFRPHTSARPSSLNSARGKNEGERDHFIKMLQSPTLNWHSFNQSKSRYLLYTTWAKNKKRNNCSTYVLHCTNKQCQVSQQLQSSLFLQLWNEANILYKKTFGRNKDPAFLEGMQITLCLSYHSYRLKI